MDIILINLFLLIVIGILSIPILLGIWLWKKGLWGKAGAILLATFLSFEIYRSFFPFDDFYEYEFTKVSGLPFPKSGNILEKYASYPDIHGDYEACAIIEVSEDDYKDLEIEIKETKDFKDSHMLCSQPWASQEFYKLSSLSEDGGYAKTWGLLSNSNKVFISYVSW